jgi:hypothetical protein
MHYETELPSITALDYGHFLAFHVFENETQVSLMYNHSKTSGK